MKPAFNYNWYKAAHLSIVGKVHPGTQNKLSDRVFNLIVFNLIVFTGIWDTLLDQFNLVCKLL